MAMTELTLSQKQAGRILIIGGGAAGLACGWRLALRGGEVTIVEAGRCGGGALWASGGMLAAGFESAFELEARHPLAPAFSRFLHECLSLWEGWAPQLQTYSDLDLGYEQFGSITPAFSKEEEAQLDEGLEQARSLDVPAMRVDADMLGQMEPALATGQGAIVFSQDGQLDNRALGPILVQAFRKAGGCVREGVRVQALDRVAGEVRGVELDTGERLEADLVIMANGADPLSGAPRPARIDPVKGQMVGFELPRDLAPKRVVRGLSIYLAAKPGRRLIAGASVEPHDRSTHVTPQTLEALTRAARSTAPVLETRDVQESWAGLRPRSEDSMPVVGEVEPGLYLALGGYRNGVLAAPGLARLLEENLGWAPLSEAGKLFTPARFDPIAAKR